MLALSNVLWHLLKKLRYVGGSKHACHEVCAQLCHHKVTNKHPTLTFNIPHCRGVLIIEIFAAYCDNMETGETIYFVT